MATIYRFIVENKVANGGDGRTPRDSSGKKGVGKKTTTLLGSMKGGVEHNRYMRAVNPVLNKATGGWYEKGTRVGRAALGLVKFDKETGAFAGVSGTAITIIIAFALQMLLKWQQKERQKAQNLNAQNYKMLENGSGAIHSEYSISVNMLNGRQTYNENK